jgi:hypothetical protein
VYNNSSDKYNNSSRMSEVRRDVRSVNLRKDGGSSQHSVFSGSRRTEGYISSISIDSQETDGWELTSQLATPASTPIPAGTTFGSADASGLRTCATENDESPCQWVSTYAHVGEGALLGAGVKATEARQKVEPTVPSSCSALQNNNMHDHSSGHRDDTSWQSSANGGGTAEKWSSGASVAVDGWAATVDVVTGNTCVRVAGDSQLLVVNLWSFLGFGFLLVY